MCLLSRFDREKKIPNVATLVRRTPVFGASIGYRVGRTAASERIDLNNGKVPSLQRCGMPLGMCEGSPK